MKTALIVIGFIVGSIQCAVAQVQQPKIPRIGYLTGAGTAPSQAFIQGLRDLGYVEGKNIAIEYRSANGKRDRVPDLATELVRLKVDIIVADGSAATSDAKEISSTIPIVMTSSTDPVGIGLVASLARPGGNVTGLTSLTGELGGKNLELLKEVVPGLSRAGILSSGSAANVVFEKETEPTARSLGIKLLHEVARRPEDIEGAFRRISKERANGLLSRLGPNFTSAQHKRLAELSAKSRLPTISTDRDWADLGGLLY